MGKISRTCCCTVRRIRVKKINVDMSVDKTWHQGAASPVDDIGGTDGGCLFRYLLYDAVGNHYAQAFLELRLPAVEHLRVQEYCWRNGSQFACRHACLFTDTVGVVSLDRTGQGTLPPIKRPKHRENQRSPGHVIN